MTTAVLALQGAFAEHRRVLEALGEHTVELRRAEDLRRDFDRLVLPGGESTVQGKLLREQGMLGPLRERVEAGMPVLGTCAGLILLAARIDGDQREARGHQHKAEGNQREAGCGQGETRVDKHKADTAQGGSAGAGAGGDRDAAAETGASEVPPAADGGEDFAPHATPRTSGAPALGTLPVTVRRNAYGRQLASFHTRAAFAGLGDVPMTFIRAPQIVEVGDGVEVLAEVAGAAVAVRYGNQVATAFHPELDGDTRIHELFLALG